MPFFSYKVKDSQGRFFKGLVEAKSESSAKDILTEYGYEIIFLKLAKRKSLFSHEIPLFKKVSSKELMILSRRFSILISSNLPMVEVLETLARQTKNQRLRVVLSKIADKVEGGTRLSESLAEYPEIFDNFYVNLVQTGERVGKLDQVLEYLAEQKEKEYDLRSRIKAMLIYPAFIFLTLIGIIIFMISFVIPRMMVILKETQTTLPLATRILINVSDFFISFWWLILFLVLLLAVGFYFLIRTNEGKIWWDKLKLRTPILGTVLQNISLVRFSTSLAILLKGGVDIVNALETVAGAMENEVYKDLIYQTAREVADGNSLASIFSESKNIPYMVTEMINIGERTGRVDKVLERISDFYTREVNNNINSLVSLIEPLIIIFMGLGVGIVVAAMILPMYRVVGGL